MAEAEKDNPEEAFPDGLAIKTQLDGQLTWETHSIKA